MMTTLPELSDHLAQRFGDRLVANAISFGDLTLTVRAADLVEVVTFLRDDERCLFTCFIDLCGVDYPNRLERFEVVTHLLSPRHNTRIRVKLSTQEDDPVPSLYGVFPGVDWFEREAYDLYGILFTGHPDLRRILTDYGFEGHPLRKDFPMTGFVEVHYDEHLKQVVYEPVELRQEMRSFDFLSPWEGTDYVLPGDEKAKVN